MGMKLNDMKISKKLFGAFSIVAIILAIVGVVGFVSVKSLNDQNDELGAIRLPSIQALLIMSEAQTAVDSNENALLSRDIDVATRQEKYAGIDAAFQRADDSWAVYAPLPQTEEEEKVWNEFVPAWEAWKRDDANYVGMSKEYDDTVADQERSAELFEQMTEQALVVNSVSFGKSEALLTQIVDIYTRQSNYDETAFKTIQSLLTISEGQTAIDSSENALMNRGITIEMRQDNYDRIDAAWARIDAAWAVYAPLKQSAEEARIWAQFVPAWDGWKADHEAYVALSKQFDTTIEARNKGEELYADLTELALVTIAESFTEAESLLIRIVDINKEVAEQTVDEATAAAKLSMTSVIIAIIVGVALAIALALMITKMITKPINTIAKEAKELAETGNLDIRATVSGKDEIGQMATALNTMLDNVAGPVKELADVATIIADGDLTKQVDIEAKGNITKLIGAFKTMVGNLQKLIGNIKTNASSTASSAEEMSASAEEVNASMEQVASTVTEVAKGAQSTSKGATDAQGASKKTGESAQAGSKAAEQVNEKMTVISQTTKEGAEKIKALGEKSQEIGKIVDTINNISEQTNLLALNAAIEAARAGEAGRGFAVVADEVRKLAEESGKATGQISDLIGGIQTEIQSSVESMDKNTKQVDEGAAAVQEALKSFQAIPGLVEGVNKSLGDMAAVAQENAAGTEEVSSSVEQVTSSMQQVSSGAQQLSAGAEELKRLVAKFKIDESLEMEAAAKSAEVKKAAAKSAENKHEAAKEEPKKEAPKVETKA